jgi:hypothetical protein
MNYFEGSGRGLYEILSWNWLGETEENQKTAQDNRGIPPKVRTERHH